MTRRTKLLAVAGVLALAWVVFGVVWVFAGSDDDDRSPSSADPAAARCAATRRR